MESDKLVCRPCDKEVPVRIDEARGIVWLSCETCGEYGVSMELYDDWPEQRTDGSEAVTSMKIQRGRRISNMQNDDEYLLTHDNLDHYIR